jgi:hypothetical protein
MSEGQRQSLEFLVFVFVCSSLQRPPFPVKRYSAVWLFGCLAVRLFGIRKRSEKNNNKVRQHQSYPQIFDACTLLLFKYFNNLNTLGARTSLIYKGFLGRTMR